MGPNASMLSYNPRLRLPPSIAPDDARPKILIVSLGGVVHTEIPYKNLVHTLEHRGARLFLATSRADCLRFLASGIVPQSIIIADERFLRPGNGDLLIHLQYFVIIGGSVVFCLDFILNTDPNMFQVSMAQVFGVRWRFHDESGEKRCVCYNDLAIPPSGFDATGLPYYFQRAALIANVEPDDQLYIAPSDSDSDDEDNASDDEDNASDDEDNVSDDEDDDSDDKNEDSDNEDNASDDQDEDSNDGDNAFDDEDNVSEDDDNASDDDNPPPYYQEPPPAQQPVGAPEAGGLSYLFSRIIRLISAGLDLFNPFKLFMTEPASDPEMRQGTGTKSDKEPTSRVKIAQAAELANGREVKPGVEATLDMATAYAIAERNPSLRVGSGGHGSVAAIAAARMQMAGFVVDGAGWVIYCGNIPEDGPWWTSRTGDEDVTSVLIAALCGLGWSGS